MSERWKILLSGFGMLLFASVFFFRTGQLQGRAEMKRWQDDYYYREKIMWQAEVAEECVIKSVPAPPPPELQKASKRDLSGYCYSDGRGGLQTGCPSCPNGGHFEESANGEVVCSPGVPAEPKPQ